MKKLIGVGAVLSILMLAACGSGGGSDEVDGVKSDFGVDLEKKVLTVGAIDDPTGPAAIYGLPYQLGKRILVEQINAGEVDILPDGWTVELVERENSYNAQQAVQAFNDIVGDVLYFATSFGAPPTIPLIPLAEQHKVVLFPGTISSVLAANEFFPTIGTPYKLESERAVDWIADSSEGKEVRLGILYQLDDYGEDSLAGVRAAAERNGIEIVSEQGIEGSGAAADTSAAVLALKRANATHVHFSVGGVMPQTLVNAQQLDFKPVAWSGDTASWNDAFLNPDLVPQNLLENLHVVTGLTTWGESSEGMDMLQEGFDKYAPAGADPHWMTLMSYSQGLLGFEAFARALESGDVTRAGYLKAVQSIDDFDAYGLMAEEVDLTTVPYLTQTASRVLRPGKDNTSWTVVADLAAPRE